MSVVPKVTAHSETAALWWLLTGDDDQLKVVLRGMSQSELREYRSQLRELARRVDGEIHQQYTITLTPPTQARTEDQCQ